MTSVDDFCLLSMMMPELESWVFTLILELEGSLWTDVFPGIVASEGPFFAKMGFSSAIRYDAIEEGREQCGCHREEEEQQEEEEF